MTNDRDLLLKVQQGDGDACDQLYKRYEDGLRWQVKNLVRNEAVADDLLQETFLRLSTRADQWNGGSVKAWLYQIVRNLALTHLDTLRRRRQQPLVIPDDEDDEAEVPAWMIDRAALGADAIFEQHERRDLLRGVVANLPKEKREVFDMMYNDEMELREIAKELDIPVGTVKSRAYYARREVAKQWTEIARKWED